MFFLIGVFYPLLFVVEYIYQIIWGMEMKALYIVIRETQYIQAILEMFLQKNIKGATILESEGMASAITRKSDLFAAMHHNTFYGQSDPEDKKHSKTIITVMKDDQVAEVVTEVRRILQPCNKRAIGFMFSMPVDDIYLIKPNNE